MIKRIKYLSMVILLIGMSMLSGCSVDLIKRYDAVIIGSGISGLTTALELSEAGKKVLIIEETGVLGGNKRFNADGISFINDTAGDTTELFKEDILGNNNDKSNYYVDNLVSMAAIIPSWLNNQGINLSNVIQLPGNSVPRTYVTDKSMHTGMAIITQMEKKLQQLGADIQYESEITKISMDTKQLYSMTISQKTNVLTINTRTVIFAEDSKRAFDSATVLEDKNQLLNFASTTKIDATTGMNLYKTINGDYSTTGDMNLIDTYNKTSGTIVTPIIRSYGGIMVNNEGQRFVNELANSYEVSEAILNQQQQKSYLIFDESIAKQLLFLSDAFTMDTIKKSTSIVELSQLIQVDESNLRNTLIDYHQQVVTNSEDAFGKKTDLFDNVFDVVGTNDNMLYAIEVTPAVTIIPTYAEVSNKFEGMSKGKIIPGVYAVGDSASDVRLDSLLYGTELTFQIAMGMESSTYILEYLKEF